MIHDEVLGKSSDLSKLLRDTTESAKNLRSKVTWGQTQRSPGVKLRQSGQRSNQRLRGQRSYQRSNQEGRNPEGSLN
jgi:hypothetical protein